MSVGQRNPGRPVRFAAAAALIIEGFDVKVVRAAQQVGPVTDEVGVPRVPMQIGGSPVQPGPDNAFGLDRKRGSRFVPSMLEFVSAEPKTFGFVTNPKQIWPKA